MNTPTTPAPNPNSNSRAVAVAEDVLRQLAREDVPLRARADRGYLSSDGWAPGGGTDLRDVANEAQRHCTVCALGALLLSKARLYGGVPLAEFGDDGRSRSFAIERGAAVRLLADTFDPADLDLIEAAFERATRHARRAGAAGGPLRAAAASGPLGDAVAFGWRHGPPRRRLAAIMENVRANGGRFAPGADDYSVPGAKAAPSPTGVDPR